MIQTLGQSPQSILSGAVCGYLGAEKPLPKGEHLTAALLQLERTAKRDKHRISVHALLGTWRLCFSAGKKAKFQSGEPVGSGFYVPKLAIASITFARNDESEHSLTVKNELQVGPLTVRFTGPARYPDKKNLLVFDFTHLQIRCFGIKVYSGKVGKRDKQSFADTAISKLPFFAFFAATDDYIAARGRGGGLAIWINEHPHQD